MDFALIDSALLTHFLELPCPTYQIKNKVIVSILDARSALIDINNLRKKEIYFNKRDLNKVKDEVSERTSFNPLEGMADTEEEIDGFQTFFCHEIIDDSKLQNLEQEFRYIFNFINVDLNLSKQYNRIRFFSHFQFIHSITLHYLISLVADKTKWSQNLKGIFYLACYAHDIGMPEVLIEENQIDEKPESLDNDTIEQVVTHSGKSVHLVDQVIEVPSILNDIIMNHHEYINGDGYPKGIKLENLKIEVQLFAIAHRWLMKAIKMSLGKELRAHHMVNTWDPKWEKLTCAPYLEIILKHFTDFEDYGLTN